MEPKSPSPLPKTPRTPFPEPVYPEHVEEEEEEEEWEEIEEEIEEEVEEEEEDPEEGEGEGEEDEEEDPEEDPEVKEREDDEPKNFIFQPSQGRQNHIIQNPKHEVTESEEEEGKDWEESDYPLSPSPSNFTVMPITRKRPSLEDSEDDEKDSRSRKKKSKRNKEEEEERKVQPLLALPAPVAVGRVWCQEDEITVLEGMIDYKNKKGVYPPNDMFAFHEFIKLKLYADISRVQMYEKVKRLKKKFLINLEKAEDNMQPVFPKPHDYTIFDLSRRIWGRSSSMANNTSGGGGDGDANAKSKSKSKSKKRRKRSKIDSIVKEVEEKEDAAMEKKSRKRRKHSKIDNIVKEVEEKEEAAMDDLGADTGDFLSKYPYLSESLCQETSRFGLVESVKSSVKDKLSLLTSAEAKEFEKEWKKVRDQEAEICLKKVNLTARQTELMLERTKNNR